MWNRWNVAKRDPFNCTEQPFVSAATSATMARDEKTVDDRRLPVALLPVRLRPARNRLEARLVHAPARGLQHLASGYGSAVSRRGRRKHRDGETSRRQGVPCRKVFRERSYLHFFQTRPEKLPLARKGTCLLTFTYRILEQGDKGFEALFYSPLGGSRNQWVPSTTVNGRAGTGGTARLEATLFDYPDYRVVINVVGKGAIEVDTIRLYQGNRQVLSEDFESQVLGPGPAPVSPDLAWTRAAGSGWKRARGS